MQVKQETVKEKEKKEEQKKNSPEEIQDRPAITINSAEDFLLLPALDKIDVLEETLDWYVAGEARNKLLAATIIFSSYTKLQQVLVIRGEESTGRRHLLQSALKLFDEEDFSEWDEINLTQLKYASKELENKKGLIISEVTKSVKPLGLVQGIAASGIDVPFRVKDKETGEYSLINNPIGKKCVVLTTGNLKCLPDRLRGLAWIVETNPSADLNEKVARKKLERRAKKYANRKDDAKTDKTCEFVSNAFSILSKEDLISELEVITLFSPFLDVMFKYKAPTVRTHSEMFCDLVALFTLLNSRNRTKWKDESGTTYVLSEVEDLKCAIIVGYPVLLNLQQGFTDEDAKILAALKSLYKSEDGHTLLEVYEAFIEKYNYEKSPKTLERRLKESAERGHVEIAAIKGVRHFKTNKRYETIDPSFVYGMPECDSLLARCKKIVEEEKQKIGDQTKS